LRWRGRRSEIRGQRAEVRGQRSATIPQFTIRNPATCNLPLATLFIALYLLVPIVCILLLSYRTPKFNPRYLMLASPALVLLLAGGLALPFARRRGDAASPRIGVRAMHILAGVALVAVIAVFLLADRNWFADPAFTKDDWRSAVAAVRSQLQPDEAVILVSGHALPAWRYYAPDVEPLRLPELEILDVNAVLDLASATPLLDQGLAGKQGAWLVQWQTAWWIQQVPCRICSRRPAHNSPSPAPSGAWARRSTTAGRRERASSHRQGVWAGSACQLRQPGRAGRLLATTVRPAGLSGHSLLAGIGSASSRLQAQLDADGSNAPRCLGRAGRPPPGGLRLPHLPLAPAASSSASCRSTPARARRRASIVCVWVSMTPPPARRLTSSTRRRAAGPLVLAGSCLSEPAGG